MGQTISVGATKHMDLFKAKLGRRLKMYEGEGFKVELEENPAGDYTFLSCHVDGGARCPEDERIKSILKQILAENLSEFILTQWENTLIKDIIRENYFYFDEDEKRLIFDYSLRHINCAETEFRYWQTRKELIKNKIIDFLNYNNRIIVDGFIRFRLQEYLAELRDAIEKAVDDFLLEREYREFIHLLQYFVEVQEPRLEMLHLVVSRDGFTLFDEKMRPVNGNCYVEGFWLDMLEKELCYEDLLLSALISMAPKKILVHYNGNNKHDIILETIKSVFAGRVTECQGCSLCVKDPE